jgi:hypothetical protein
MLRHAAEYLRAHDAQEHIDSAESNWWSRLGQALALGVPDCNYVPPSADAVYYEGELFDIEKRIIKEVVEGHAAVIVGRGAAQTLRGRAGVVSVFLHAPEPWRVERVQQVYGIADQRAAQRMVREADRARARFIHAAAGVEWTDVHAYDLAADTAALGFEAVVDLILRAVPARVASRI